MLESITPVILTCNEAPNIERTLGRLAWARDIVVVDSFSDDATIGIARRFPQVRVFQRRFDSHADQWNYAIKETRVSTEWVLALDADYILTDEFIGEMKDLKPDESSAGFNARFVYCVHGRRLRGTVYRPVTVLYRKEKASYVQDGHTQCVVLDGLVQDMAFPILHDDRKSLTRWLNAQDKYMRLEVLKLSQIRWKDMGWADRLRKLRLPFPFIMFFYCLVVKGALFDGLPGLYYAFQRMLAESLLSLYLLEHDLKAVVLNSRNNDL